MRRLCIPLTLWLFLTLPTLSATRLQNDLALRGPYSYEGHIYTAGTRQPDTLSNAVDASKPLIIMETGFNAGFSSELFLNAYPYSKVISFDLGDHNYATAAKELIDEYFPGRHILVLGDSKHTLPQFVNGSTLKADLIFVDGGHDWQTALSDLHCFRELAHPSTVVVVDDYYIQAIAEAVDECVRSGRFLIDRIETDQHKKWVVGRFIFPTQEKD
ncbi:MAG: class I SAM-dependent methyltransferase [Chlamydiia bacterium]